MHRITAVDRCCTHAAARLLASEGVGRAVEAAELSKAARRQGAAAGHKGEQLAAGRLAHALCGLPEPGTLRRAGAALLVADVGLPLRQVNLGQACQHGIQLPVAVAARQRVNDAARQHPPQPAGHGPRLCRQAVHLLVLRQQADVPLHSASCDQLAGAAGAQLHLQGSGGAASYNAL